MTGFRRVVGHSRPDPASPMDEPNSLDQYPGVALSPITSMGNPTPRKRKSADANILGVAGFRWVEWQSCLCIKCLQCAWWDCSASWCFLSLGVQFEAIPLVAVFKAGMTVVGSPMSEVCIGVSQCVQFYG